MPRDYYVNLAEGYLRRRDRLLGSLREAGFKTFTPRGAYYIMTGISTFGFSDDREFARHLVEDIGVATVPGSSFYQRIGGGSQQIRFAFCKRPETLDRAVENLRKIRQR